MNIIASPEIERRESPHIRDVFVQACELLEPIFKGNDHVKTVSNYAMGMMMKQHFPDLSTTDIQVVISTVEKVHREERLHLILNKKG